MLALAPIIGRLGAYAMILIVAWFWWEDTKAAWIQIGEQNVLIATQAIDFDYKIKIRDNQQAFEKELAQKEADAEAALEDSQNENDLQRDINQRLAEENPFQYAADFTANLRGRMQQIEDAYPTSSIGANANTERSPGNSEEPLEE